MDHRAQIVPVGRLAPGDQWDQNLLGQLFANELYPTGLDFKRVAGYPPKTGGILMVPGRYWYERIHEIAGAISNHKWVLLIRCGDEEDLFDIHQITHPNIRFWVQSPRTDRDYGDARLFGVGFPPHFNHLDASVPHKTLDVLLAAQDTHTRRHECFAVLGDREGVWPTSGFTKGLPSPSYTAHMTDAKVAPAPAGNFSPDTFRFYEALEAHAVPVADDISPQYDSAGYWRRLFDNPPFPILTNYECLPGYIDAVLSDWPRHANRVAAWWMRQKREMMLWLLGDLRALGAL